jgi:hypothetical protein
MPSRRETPRAFSSPISRVLSETETSITFMMPIPATVREIAAIPTRAAVRMVRIRPKVASTESCVSSVTSSSPCLSRRSSRIAALAAGIAELERTSTRIRKRPDWLNIRSAGETGIWTMSSRSIPIDTPRGAMTPMIRKRSSPRRSTSPSGFCVPKSSRCTLAPRTHTLWPLSASPSGR